MKTVIGNTKASENFFNVVTNELNKKAEKAGVKSRILRTVLTCTKEGEDGDNCKKDKKSTKKHAAHAAGADPSRCNFYNRPNPPFSKMAVAFEQAMGF